MLKQLCSSCTLFVAVNVLSNCDFPYPRLGKYAIGRQKLALLQVVRLNKVRVKIFGVRQRVPFKSVWDLSPNITNPTGIVVLFPQYDP
jgi:hypothetical protein